ncbi:MAG: hypothetical protein OHK0039_40140 [Bacteroidia bacterium]
MLTLLRLVLPMTALLALGASHLHAQFMRSYATVPFPYTHGQHTSDGGYILLATTNFQGLGQVPYLVRTDYRGDTLWTRAYHPFGPTETGRHVLQTSDGGYLVSGERKPGTLDFCYAFKTDAAGNLLWDKVLAATSSTTTGTVEVPGGYALAGTRWHNGSLDYYLVRMDSSGDTLWTRTYDLGLGSIDRCHRFIRTSDGGYLLAGSRQDLVNTASVGVLLKVDSAGVVQWQTDHGASGYEVEVLDIAMRAGGYVGVGNRIDNITGASTGYLYYYDNGGQLTQSLAFGQGVPRSMRRLAVLPGGDLLLAADVYTATAADILLMRTTASGGVLWSSRLSTLAINVNDVAFAVGYTQAGGYYVVGHSSISSNLLLVVTDSLGQAETHTLQGRWFEDLNLNCLLDVGETPYATLPLGIAARNLATQAITYGNIDSSGQYQLTLSLGDYELTPQPHPYLDYVCQPLQTVSFTQPHQTLQADVAFTWLHDCPLNRVDVSSLLLQVGDSCTIDVQACNEGSIASYPTTVQVVLDSFLTYGSASLPLLSQSGQTLTFALDTLEAGACRTFAIRAWLDSTVLPGQTHCLEAKIWPDTVCGATWSGPQIRAAVTCLGDSVRFDLTNTGTDMQVAHGHSIYIDDVIFRMGTFLLGSGMTEQLFEPAVPGATYRIEAVQAPGFPGTLGDPRAIAFAEGCLPYPDGTFQTGWITAFYNGNSAPSEALTCIQNRTSYDPNDKLAEPVGYGAPHFIYDDTPLDYQIRFQNTGTAAALRVVIADTLSPALDPLTIEPGAASHPYTWRVDDQGVLRFTFRPIFLPDSSSDPEGSQGYVRFRIRQRPGNAPGIRIDNRAAIYFDYNVAVITPDVWHTIGEDFVRVEVVSTAIGDALPGRVRVWPNPAADQVRLAVDDGHYARLTCHLYDLLGQPVLHQTATGRSGLTLDLAALPAGVYSYCLEGDGRALGRGLLRKQ